MLTHALIAIAGTSFGQVSDDASAAKAQLLADAATRTSLGSDSLFQGDAPVRLGGLIQARYTGNIRDTESGSSEESFTHGFSLPRTRLDVAADLNETWSVFIQGDFAADGGTFTLLDAWADWKLDENWMLRGGQFKVPTTREWQIDPDKQLAADRSVVNSVFSAGRTQGLAAVYVSDQFVFVGAVDDGAGTANTDFNSGAEADYGVTGRLDWLFSGDRAQLGDFQGWRGQEMAGQVGGFAHYQDGGSTGVGQTGSTADVSLLQALVDVQIEGNGWSAYGAGVWRMVDMAGGDSLNHFGALIQGGYFVSESDELFGRYDVVVPDSDTPGGDDAFNTLTFGWNHFFIPESNASRFTLDLQWFLNETTGNGLVTANNGVGLLESGEKNQIAFRAQYQATF